MKINEVLYKTPEMTEERLLEIMHNNLSLLKDKTLLRRIHGLHEGKPLTEAILKEYDLIQDKNSYLTKSQRDNVVGFVGLCVIQMTKDNESGNH